ncbi:MAG: excinuclease ABC subunit A [Campylobacterota bacterium]|nr:excinuclease ABC subunit A [Campylobacterota bacterium]
MKPILVVTLLIFAAASLQARDTTLMMPINSALKKGRAQGIIDPRISLQFGKRSRRGNQGTYTANRKTNSFNKTDREACEWAFFSAVKSLQDRARQRGVRRVTGIISYYDKRPRSSSSTYECHAGGVVAGVVLRGNI